MGIDGLFQQAVGLARQGDRAGARKIVSDLVRTNPKEARLWYLLSQLVEQPDQAQFCLNKVLAIDPGNLKAQQRLAALQAGGQAVGAAVPPAPRPTESPVTRYIDEPSWAAGPPQDQESSPYGQGSAEAYSGFGSAETIPQEKEPVEAQASGAGAPGPVPSRVKLPPWLSDEPYDATEPPEIILPPAYVPPQIPGMGSYYAQGEPTTDGAAGEGAAAGAEAVDPWTGKQRSKITLTKRRKTLNDLEIPKKKNDFFGILVIGVMVLVVCFVFVCVGLPLMGVSLFDQAIIGTVGDLPLPEDGGYRVTYRLEGEAGEVIVIYYNEKGRMTNQRVGLPWERTQVMQVGMTAGLTARTRNRNTKLTCTVMVDEIEWRRSTDSGDFSMVSCTGRLTP